MSCAGQSYHSYVGDHRSTCSVLDDSLRTHTKNLAPNWGVHHFERLAWLFATRSTILFKPALAVGLAACSEPRA